MDTGKAGDLRGLRLCTKILSPYGLVSGGVDPRARALPEGLHAANQRANVQASALSAYVEDRKWNGSFSWKRSGCGVRS